jgi:hypothetical protein
MCYRVALSLLLAALLVPFAGGQIIEGKKKGTPVKPAREWGAVLRKDDLAKEAPKSGLITDAKSFAKLWKAWRGAEKVPDITFDKHFVLVVLSLGGPNRPNISATLDEKGTLAIAALRTLIGGPGFGYSLAVFERKGIKTVNGKPLPKN